MLGKDFPGAVDAIGAGVSDYQVGDRVFGVVTKTFLGDGRRVRHRPRLGLSGQAPEGIDFTTGAELGLARAAALASVDAAELEPSHSALITGATGGVGNRASQLAKQSHTPVTATTASAEDTTLVTALDADDTGGVVGAIREAHPDGWTWSCPTSCPQRTQPSGGGGGGGGGGLGGAGMLVVAGWLWWGVLVGWGGGESQAAAAAAAAPTGLARPTALPGRRRTVGLGAPRGSVRVASCQPRKGPVPIVQRPHRGAMS